MKKLFSIFAFAIVVLMMAACSDKGEPVGGDEYSEFVPIELSRSEQGIVSQHNAFSFELFGRLATGSWNESFMVSPLSVSMVMSMLANGAQGETRSEILTTLGFKGDELDAVNSFNKRLANDLTSVDKSIKFSLANSIWIDNEFKVYDSFLSSNKDAYGAEIFNAELSTEKTRQDINAWASDKTMGLIPEFLKDRLSDDAKLFLMNALYFKGMWSEKFDKALTIESEFHNSDGSVSRPKMMNNPDMRFIACRDEDATWAKFNYGNGAYELVLVLPDSKDGFVDYISGLTENDLAEINEQWNAYQGKISFPKFDIKSSFQLEDIIKAMGVEKAFTLYLADFSLISEKDICISRIKHDTNIIFDENGTEAAAVTGTTGDVLPGMLPSMNLTFDSPFAFMIRERSTKSILFMGCVNKI